MSLVGSVARGAAKSAVHAGTHMKTMPKASIKSVKTMPGKAKAMPGRVKAQGKAFNHAMRTTPGESLGEHIKSHRVGTAFTVGGTAADAADIYDNHRRSSHGGIDTR